MTAVASIFKLHNVLRESLKHKMGVERLTHIQDVSFVPVSAHKDVVIHSECGSGKTLAYLLPLLNRRLYLADHQQAAPVLVLQPTNILCEQAAQVISDLLPVSASVKTQLLTADGRDSGGGGVFRSPRIHWGEVDVLVATPARYVADMSRNCPMPSTVVLDEADLLLQGASSHAVQRILEDYTGQTILAAATIPNALSLRIHRRWSTAVWARDDRWHSFYRSSIKTHFLSSPTETQAKLVQLATEALPLVLDGVSNSRDFLRVLVFCATPKQTREVAAFLAERGWPVKPTAQLEIACVTDGSGRGVDWKSVGGVVNFSAPGDVQMFLHRAGRLQCVRGGTGGGRGVVVTMVDSSNASEEARMRQVRQVVEEEVSVPQKLHGMFSTRRSFRNKLVN